MSNFALGGLLAGLGFAAIDWFILLPLLERPLRARLATLTPAERVQAEGRLRLLRTIFAAQFIAFPLLGYILGRFLEGSA
jgi:hypothetical protein